MSEVNALVQQAISAYKANDKAKAKELLLKAVDLDEHNEQAWMWMSAVVDSPEEQQICLENVIQLNPNNERAKKGLAVINEKLGKPAAPPPPTPTPAPAPTESDNPWANAGFDSSPFSASDPPAAEAAPAAHGSGATGDPTTGEQYDNWIDNLGISGGSSEAPTAPEPAESASPFTSAASSDDPWANLDSSADPAQAANPFAADSNAPADPWAQTGSDSSDQQADPWGNAAGDSSASNPFSTDASGGDPWGSVTGVDPWATSSGQGAPASDPFGTSSGAGFPDQEEPLAESAPPEVEDERATAGFEFAEDSTPSYSSFDFDAVDEIEEDDFNFSEGDLQDDPFGDEDDLGDGDPFASVDDDASPVVAAQGSHYFQQIPEELRGKGGGSSRGTILLVAILLLLNLAAAAGLVIG